jgi:assimilatory nitrate reductase catalytic subunit
MFREWQTPEAVFDILRKLSRGRPCDFTGITDTGMLDQAGGLQWPFPEGSALTGNSERRLFADGTFFHGDGRARMIADLPTPPPDPLDEAYPLWLLTGRGSSAQWHTETRTAKAPVLQGLHAGCSYVEINIAQARALGIGRHEWVRIVSRRATIRARAVLTWHVQEGQLFMPMHDPTVNRLLKPVFDPHSRQPSYKACAVRVERETAGDG